MIIICSKKVESIDVAAGLCSTLGLPGSSQRRHLDFHLLRPGLYKKLEQR